MASLFEIETERVALTWSEPKDKDKQPLMGLSAPPGRLFIRLHNEQPSPTPIRVYRAGLPEGADSDMEQTSGPRLYEYTTYKVFVRAKEEQKVSLDHRDPLILRDIDTEQNDTILHGNVNFGSQIGRSIFTVLVDGQPEFDFETEIFPTKLDYASDYEQLLAEVQEIMTALALEYLRATFKAGIKADIPQPTHLEWLNLLRHIVDDLERALMKIAQQPIRGISRRPVNTRIERVKRVDSAMRSAIRNGQGSGRWEQLKIGISVRQRLPERRAKPTLDTPEHRWIATQLDRILAQLAQIRSAETVLPKSQRRQQTLRDLDTLKTHIARLSRLEPISKARGNPPSGFASLQLLTAPGYREAYQACLILSLGLRIEEGPMNLSVKDLHLLYEYWCYLAIVRIIAEEVGQAIPVNNLFTITSSGLRVLLRKRKESTVKLTSDSGRKVRVIYNPRIHGKSVLIPQQPDIMLTFEDPGWPPLKFILDAKYRVDATEKYQERYGTPGPPDDALNVLHRYRDAILANESGGSQNQPKRVVVQAAALFPYYEQTPEEFAKGRLWQALDQLGIGAIPFLPGSTHYLRSWLHTTLREGGWSLVDKVIEHNALERAHSWRTAASETVLIGPLRPANAEQHLNWTREHQIYYMPDLKSQPRQYTTKCLGFYYPSHPQRAGAVTHKALVKHIEVKPRGKIKTPWSSSLAPEVLCVIYTLGKVQTLRTPIENRKGQRFSGHRWTSRLALERAQVLEELLLETEPEWRLYEELTSAKITFKLRADLSKRENLGHAWFILEDSQIRYIRASGFLLRSSDGTNKYFASSGDIVQVLKHRADV